MLKNWTKTFFSLTVVLTSFANTSVGACDFKSDTPAHLMQTIRYLAAQEQYDELQKFVYPLNMPDFPDGPINVQQAVIEGIRLQTERYDFAYSDAAISELLNHHIDKFRALSPTEVQKMDDLFKYAPSLLAIAKKNPADFLMFDFQANQVCGPGTAILLVKQANAYQLIFWEDLNCLLPESEHKN